jgi:hypothetical protein
VIDRITEFIFYAAQWDEPLTCCSLGLRFKMMFTNTYEETEGRLNSGNACYLSIQNLLCSRLFSKNLNIKHKLILPVVVYGYESWFLH